MNNKLIDSLIKEIEIDKFNYYSMELVSDRIKSRSIIESFSELTFDDLQKVFMEYDYILLQLENYFSGLLQQKMNESCQAEQLLIKLKSMQ